MKKSTVVLAIAAICMLAVIGCKNVAVTPPVTPPDSNPTTMLSARFIDSTPDKTYDFSLEKPAATSTVVSDKLYSHALAKTFSLKGLVNAVSGDFKLSMRSSTEGIRADVTGNTKKTDGTGLTLKVSIKGAGDTWLDATSINLDAASVKAGTDAVEVPGTVDPTAQDVGLPNEMLGTWKMDPTYSKKESDPRDPYRPLSLPSLMFVGVIADSKITEPYYAVKGHGSWFLWEKETVDGKTTLWDIKDSSIIDQARMEQTDWVEYAKKLDYYTKENADFVVTQMLTIYPFEFKVSVSDFTTLKGTVSKEEEEEIEAYLNKNGTMIMPFLEIAKKDGGFDVITKTDDPTLGYIKYKYSLASNGLKLRTYVADTKTGLQAVDSIEEASALTILTDEGFAGIFTR